MRRRNAASSLFLWTTAKNVLEHINNLLQDFVTRMSHMQINYTSIQIFIDKMILFCFVLLFEIGFLV